MTADILLSQVVTERDLSEAEARALVDSIRVDVADLGDRIATAYLGRAWVALGHASWDALCEAEFDGARLRIPREQRAEQVQSLRAAGLSTRAIGTALGVGVATVHRDLASAPNGTDGPATVQSLDGRTRPASQPTHPAAPAAPRPGAPTPEAPAAATAIAEQAGAHDVITHTTTTREQFIADRATGEVLSVEDWQQRPEPNPLAAARAEVARQPVIVTEKAVDRLRTARLTFEAAGSPADVIADLANSSPDTDNTGFWLAEIESAIGVLNGLAVALRRRNLRSVSR